MIGLSQTVGYAIQAMSCLTDLGEGAPWVQVKHIAEKTQVPEPYLAKVVYQLAQKKLVHTKRGVGGGIQLARSADQITLLDLVLAIEGDDWISDCLLGMDTCHALGYCPLSDFWSGIHRQVEAELSRTTVTDILVHNRRKCCEDQVA